MRMPSLITPKYLAPGCHQVESGGSKHHGLLQPAAKLVAVRTYPSYDQHFRLPPTL
jgi:hypothetical protein